MDSHDANAFGIAGEIGLGLLLILLDEILNAVDKIEQTREATSIGGSSLRKEFSRLATFC